MGKRNTSKLLILVLPGFLLLGCYKNYTKNFSDSEDPELSIFSNTGNNIMSCFIDGKPWRTIDREFRSGLSGIGRTIYELTIRKEITTALSDTLFIHWQGTYSGEEYPQGIVSLVLAVPKNFTYRSFSALQGQRLKIDSSSNGFFSAGISGLNIGNPKGNGSIYFHTARLDSVGPDKYTGAISGLLEADFPLFKIIKGRFDGELNEENIDL